MCLPGDERKHEAAACPLAISSPRPERKKKKIPVFLLVHRSRNINNETSEEPALSEEGLDTKSEPDVLIDEDLSFM